MLNKIQFGLVIVCFAPPLPKCRDVILGHLGVEFTSGGTTIQLIYIETEQELKGSLK